MNSNPAGAARMGRRAFLKGGTLLMTAGCVPGPTGMAAMATRPGTTPKARFGLITDLHYADKPPAGTRHYRETPAKLAESADQFRRDRPNFLVELGDLIDSSDSVDVELGYLDRINRDLSAISGERHYVLGNHCVDTLTKEEFLGRVRQERSFYSFDVGGVHFVAELLARNVQPEQLGLLRLKLLVLSDSSDAIVRELAEPLFTLAGG